MPRTRILDLPLDRLTPAAVNGVIYRPVDPADPASQALADDVRTNGQLEPGVITKDNVILSGHRRYAACQAAGLTRPGTASHCQGGQRRS